MQIRLATTCGKNELQQDAKSNDKLLIDWTKTTWKPFEVTATLCRNRSITASLVTDCYYCYCYCYYYGCDCFLRRRYCIFSLVSFWCYIFLHPFTHSSIHSFTHLPINPYPTAFPYGNGMVLHFYKQQESSTTKTVHRVINKGLKAYV